MSVTRGLAAAAVLAGLAVGTASAAWAAPTMSGHYIETWTAANGQSGTNDWYFTPCGDGCASAAVGGPSHGPLGQARLVNGQWTLDSAGDWACPDGSHDVPDALSLHFTWDPNTLAGTVQSTIKVPACGHSPGQQWTNNIQLRQAEGSSPNKEK
jgi:hypothetical protein